MVSGYLILRSGYLPRGLGAILILGGASFIAKNFLVVLAPQYDLPYVIVPMFLAIALSLETMQTFSQQLSLRTSAIVSGVDRP